MEPSVHQKYFLSSFLIGLEGFSNTADPISTTERLYRNASLEEIAVWFEVKSHENVLLNGIYWILAGITLLSRSHHSIQQTTPLPSNATSNSPTNSSSNPPLSNPSEFLTPHSEDPSPSTILEITPYLSRIVSLIQSCYDSNIGGYRSHPDHPDSILATMSAVQSLILLEKENLIQPNPICAYVASLQDSESGSFFPSIGTPWTSEADLRFSLCALVILRHLNVDLSSQNDADLKSPLHYDSSNEGNTLTPRWSVVSQNPARCKSLKLEVPSDLPTCNHSKSSIPYSTIPTPWNLDLALLIKSILSSQNMDGGFGSREGNESHSGYTYCAVACLAILGQLKLLHRDQKLTRLCR